MVHPSLACDHRTEVHRLRHHQTLSLPRPLGLCLRAERGTLWVTVDGRPEDIELERGHCLRFEQPARVVVSALGGDAVLSTTRPRAVPLGVRLRAWLGRGASGLPA